MNKMNKDILKQIIIDTIKEEEHLGDNLKKQCVDYIEQLQNNRNELKKWLVAREFRYGTRIDIQEVLKKMQEMEQMK